MYGATNFWQTSRAALIYNMEEEIKNQTWGDDELNKGVEEIHRAPRRYIPVPKVRKDKTVKQNGDETEQDDE